MMYSKLWRCHCIFVINVKNIFFEAIDYLFLNFLSTGTHFSINQDFHFYCSVLTVVQLSNFSSLVILYKSQVMMYSKLLRCHCIFVIHVQNIFFEGIDCILISFLSTAAHLSINNDFHFF